MSGAVYLANYQRPATIIVFDDEFMDAYFGRLPSVGPPAPVQSAAAHRLREYTSVDAEPVGTQQDEP